MNHSPERKKKRNSTNSFFYALIVTHTKQNIQNFKDSRISCLFVETLQRLLRLYIEVKNLRVRIPQHLTENFCSVDSAISFDAAQWGTLLISRYPSVTYVCHYWGLEWFHTAIGIAVLPGLGLVSLVYPLSRWPALSLRSFAFTTSLLLPPLSILTVNERVYYPFPCALHLVALRSAIL